MSEYEISVVVRGPERTVDTNYGPRKERDQLASFVAPVSQGLVWKIFQGALQGSVSPQEGPNVCSPGPGIPETGEGE